MAEGVLPYPDIPATWKPQRPSHEATRGIRKDTRPHPILARGLP